MKQFKFSLFIALLLPILAFGQQSDQKEKNYYVNSKSSALFDSTSTKATILHKFDRYDNVTLVENITNSWIKIRYKTNIGYAKSSDFKPGKAVVSYYTVRTGARCKDGSRSSATGRGACSHHGGVARWLTTTKKSVRIVDN